MKTEDRMTVGELSKAAGVTIRTLHHYDALGLLTPLDRSPAGYRLYGMAEVIRLQQIVVLKELGLSLNEIGFIFDEGKVSLGTAIQVLLERERDEITRKRDLVSRLERLATALEGSDEVNLNQILELTREVVKMELKHTSEQVELLLQRHENAGENQMQRVQEEWDGIVAQVRAALESGMAPDDAAAKALATRWVYLVEQFSNGDQDLAHASWSILAEDPASHGLEAAEVPLMQEFITKAFHSSGTR